jgi:hypothetical protein
VRRYILASLIIGTLLLSNCADHTPTPQGNYIATIIPEVYETAKFCDNTLELCNPRDGTRIFEYEIVEEGTKIKLTNVETGETVTRPFKHILTTTKYGDEREAVIINQLIYYPENP